MHQTCFGYCFLLFDVMRYITYDNVVYHDQHLLCMLLNESMNILHYLFSKLQNLGGKINHLL